MPGLSKVPEVRVSGPVRSNDRTSIVPDACMQYAQSASVQVQYGLGAQDSKLGRMISQMNKLSCADPGLAAIAILLKCFRVADTDEKSVFGCHQRVIIAYAERGTADPEILKIHVVETQREAVHDLIFGTIALPGRTNICAT